MIQLILPGKWGLEGLEIKAEHLAHSFGLEVASRIALPKRTGSAEQDIDLGWKRMRIVFALILIGHGFAHLAGFFLSWRITKDMPYKTTILAKSVDIGDLGIRIVGVLWLIAALGFAVSAISFLMRDSWWLPLTGVSTAFSFLLCVLEWPDARIGAFANVGIAALLLFRLDWLR